MSLNVYYERDADPTLLRGRGVAVIGYGNQGHAHALNIRDSGGRVLVVQRPGAGQDRARADGFEPVDIDVAAREADLLIIALPDELIGVYYREQLAARLRPGQALGFVHGFAVRFGQVAAPCDVDVIMVAPKGPGTLVRSAFQRGGGLACIVAVQQNATGVARDLALAWGAAVGGGKGGMIESTFAAECESDLFGEQAVLCGGVIELMKCAFEVLTEAGVPDELAYFECIHEVKQVVDLQYAEGIAGMRSRISRTAAYGGLTRGPFLIDDGVRERMRSILREVQDGRFAREWLDDAEAGGARFAALQARERAHAGEAAGARVREWVRNAIPETRAGRATVKS